MSEAEMIYPLIDGSDEDHMRIPAVVNSPR